MTDEIIKVAEDAARSGFFLISGTVLATVFLAITTILVARFLGPELYGQYALALVVPQLLFLFTDLGINQGIIKFTASLRAEGETNHLTKIIKYGLLLRTCTGIVIFLISYAFADLFASVFLQRPDLAFYVRIASTLILFQVIFTVTTSAFVGLDRTEYNALITNMQAVAKTIISIALVLLGFSVAGAIIGNVASYIVAAVVGVFILSLILRKKQSAKNSHSLKRDLKTLIHYGAPLYLSMLLTGFIPLYQNIVLAFFTTDADVGNYKAATNFATLITVISIPIITALLPAFSKLESSTDQKIKTFFEYANKYTTILVIPITVLIIIFSSDIVEIIYGSTYQSAPLFLSTYCLLYFLVGIGLLTLTSFYSGLGETRTTLKMNLIAFLTLAVLSPILTKTYSVLGLIIAFLMAGVTGTSYGSYTARKKFKIEFDAKTLAKIYLISITSSILPILVLHTSPMPKLFNITTGAFLYLFTYITLIPITRIVNHTELKTATHILRKIKPLTPLIQPLIKYQQKILDRQRPTTRILQDARAR